MTVQKRKQSDLSLSRLREVLSYEPSTGRFLMLTSRGRKKAGSEAGYINNEGYRLIAIDRKWFLAHRLAWYYETGEWPTFEIDHANGDPSDNSFSNLRCSNRSGNEANSIRKNNKSGFRGVTWARTAWQAIIRKDGAAIYLGRFDSAEEASEAYKVAAERLHGEFAFHKRPPKPAKQEALL